MNIYSMILQHDFTTIKKKCFYIIHPHEHDCFHSDHLQTTNTFFFVEIYYIRELGFAGPAMFLGGERMHGL